MDIVRKIQSFCNALIVSYCHIYGGDCMSKFVSDFIRGSDIFRYADFRFFFLAGGLMNA